MITYRNQLKNSIDSLQKLIDDISELNIGGVKMGGGVIVDITCNKIVTNSLITDELQINNSITTTEINSSNITTDNIKSTNSISNTVTINDKITIFKAANEQLSLTGTSIDGQKVKATLKSLTTSENITTNSLRLYDTFYICAMYSSVQIKQVQIQIRDSATNYPLGTTAEGFAFAYNNIWRFFMCTCTVQSNMTGWYTPMVRIKDSVNLTIYAKNYDESDYKIYFLKYIVGQYYTTLNVGTIFQYSNVSRYENRIYRDSSGAIFPYEGCLIEWIYAERKI